MDSKLNFHKHCASLVSKTNQHLSIIKRSFSSLEACTLLQLHKSLIRPILEYGNVVWGPRYKLDQLALEKVQWRATKLVPALYNHSYNERLHMLSLPSLYYRHRRGIMITTYNILTNKVNIDQSQFFQKRTSFTTRGHNFKLFKFRSMVDLRRQFFQRAL